MTSYIYCIKNNKVLYISEDSQSMAEKIKDLNEFKDTKITTISRNIRNRVHDNKSYKGYYFQRIDIKTN